MGRQLTVVAVRIMMSGTGPVVFDFSVETPSGQHWFYLMFTKVKVE